MHTHTHVHTNLNDIYFNAQHWRFIFTFVGNFIHNTRDNCQTKLITKAKENSVCDLEKMTELKGKFYIFFFKNSIS